MKRVYVASANPVKLAAAKHGFEQMFPGEEFDVLSFKNQVEITSQPMTDKETVQGAWKRANNIRELAPEAEYWVGIEGGCEDKPGGLCAFAWVVVLDASRCGRGRSGEFFA
jgi:inosine/xanthosine triphosphatase